VKSLFAAAFCGGFFVLSPTFADTFCGQRDDFVTVLRDSYAEIGISNGLTPEGELVELFVSGAGSFTVLVTLSSGISCVVAAGENWDRAAGPANKLPLSPGTVH